MSEIVTLYHGSKGIVEKPMFGLGKVHNDFGRGFYCTENPELAKEWAVTGLGEGYCNRYSIDTQDIRILYLNSSEYTILNWVAVLIEHRAFSLGNPIAGRAKKYLLEKFGVNVNAYDVIVGYRADDSYFDYAEAFLNNSITVEQLAEAMRLGKPDEQFVIKSEYAFSLLRFEGAEKVQGSTYYPLRKNRDNEANESYRKILESKTDGLYIQDIICGGIGNDDPRIPRNVSK